MTQTHWKKLHNPDYLGAWSITPNEDLIATIKTVGLEMVTGTDGKKEELTVVHFMEDIKPMILNVTNSKTIAKVHQTPYIEEWAGKQIQLYSTPVKAFGETVEALRVRPKKPTTTKEEFNPSHPSWAKAIKSLKEGRVSIAGIRKKYNLSDANEQLLMNESI